MLYILTFCSNFSLEKQQVVISTLYADIYIYIYIRQIGWIAQYSVSRNQDPITNQQLIIVKVKKIQKKQRDIDIVHIFFIFSIYAFLFLSSLNVSKVTK